LEAIQIIWISGRSSSGLLVAVDNSPVASKSPNLTGSLMVQTASRLVAAIQRGPVSVTSPGLPGRAAAPVR